MSEDKGVDFGKHVDEIFDELDKRLEAQRKKTWLEITQPDKFKPQGPHDEPHHD